MTKLKLNKTSKVYKLIKLSKIYKKHTHPSLHFGNIHILYHTLYIKYYSIILLQKRGIAMTKGLMRIFLKILNIVQERW